MTQEDKDLLLKDLCARLPFKVKVEAKGLLKTIADDHDNKDIINAHVLNGLNLRDYFKTYSIDSIEKVPLFNRKGVCNIKPYLFPLSSMTEEQLKDAKTALHQEITDIYENCSEERKVPEYPQTWYYVQDWYNAHHFDYRGLIPKGLAIDATGLNIY